jgi:tetratricopeptide (TPR) repeat protein
MTKVKLLVGILADRLRGNPEASGELVFEAIDLLSRILHHEPNDPTALVTMADLSFDQRAFSKALSFYERYLKVSPDDLGARARYASTLTFLGRYDDSVSELKGVLRSDPKNFPALAYLAITYAQKGDLQEARKSASIALSLAPSEEAKARFSGFVASLGEPGRGELNKQPEGAQTGVAGFIQSIKSNPVAGDKFRSYEGPSDGVLRLKFVDFPMAQMPPFAKQKFFDRLREGLKTNAVSGLSALEFVDADSGVLLDRLSLAD